MTERLPANPWDMGDGATATERDGFIRVDFLCPCGATTYTGKFLRYTSDSCPVPTWCCVVARDGWCRKSGRWYCPDCTEVKKRQ